MSITLPLPNPSAPLSSLFVGDGQTCHGSLIDFEHIFGVGGKWPLTGSNRYRFWMFFSNSGPENSITLHCRVSNSAPGTNDWVGAPITITAVDPIPWNHAGELFPLGVGLPNQISSDQTQYNDDNDPEAVYNPTLDCIWVYWNDESIITVYADDGTPVASADGRIRINNQLVLDEAVMLPTFNPGAAFSVVMESPTRWHSWGVNSQWPVGGQPWSFNGLGYQFSVDGTTWGYPEGPGFVPGAVGGPCQYDVPLTTKYGVSGNHPMHPQFKRNPFVPDWVDIVTPIGDDGHGVFSQMIYLRTYLSNPLKVDTILPTLLLDQTGHWSNNWYSSPAGFYRSTFTMRKNSNNEVVVDLFADVFIEGLTDQFGFTSGPIYALPGPVRPLKSSTGHGRISGKGGGRVSGKPS